MILQVESDAAYLVAPKARSRAGGYHFLGSANRSQYNAPILVIARIIKNVMSSAAEAEIGSLYMNAREAIPIRYCLIDLGHPQPPTPLITDNTTARGIIRGTMKQRQSKAIDMRFHWLFCRYEQDHFDILWEPGRTNLGDYTTKHHPARYHRTVRPIYLHTKDSPKTMQGCIKILEATHRPLTVKTSNLAQ